jgi:two-component system chemotaxis response regulator CheB
MIKVLIVDDSKVVQELIEYILTSDPDIMIVGIASSGQEAIKLTREKQPDIITMDFHMPDMDGSDATRAIMEHTPTPIVIVSGSMGTTDVTHSFELIEAGALAVILRPPGIQHPNFKNARRELIKTVKLMSEVRVVRHYNRKHKTPLKSTTVITTDNGIDRDLKLVAIGASTGGPAALQRILTGLPKGFPLPVVIVQHISQGFLAGFVQWLSTTTAIPLRIPSDGEIIKAGTAYMAPDGFHMGVQHGLVIMLSTMPPENGLRPSVDHLFRSVARVVGKNAIGVLLTGMGKDGAAELKEMRDMGAITIAQDEESSVIFGMPGEAVRIGAAEHVLPLDKIAEALTELVKSKE